MNIDKLKTNKNDLQDYLQLILIIPEKLNKIDIDIKKELILEIDERILHLSKTITGLINVNNNYYLYPENYLPNRLFEYWADRISEQFYFNELKYLKKMISNNLAPLEKIENEVINNNPFDKLFINFEVYNCFLEYTKKHIIEFYSDYSYLKKRLENQKLIHYHKDNDFINIVFNEMHLIKKSDYDNYLTKYESKLKSLSKSYNIQRENNFNTIFESLI